MAGGGAALVVAAGVVAVFEAVALAEDDAVSDADSVAEAEADSDSLAIDDGWFPVSVGSSLTETEGPRSTVPGLAVDSVTMITTAATITATTLAMLTHGKARETAEFRLMVSVCRTSMRPG